ncbi:enoyl-CoA hydratase/isomerase family protein [Rhodococcus qingshengii]|uniref:enoyl-CoA hydratase/isomerase family protein n=1 Tax=Rhodococcus qingshengii TaxID=334542 RepID=UPI0035DAEC76
MISEQESESASREISLIRRGSALWATIERPHAMNSLTLGVLRGIEEAVDAVEESPDLRALVIAGSGRAFSAGADLTGVPDVTSAEGGADDFRSYLTEAGKAFARLASCRRPTIAAVHGYALAGGLELALSCDIIVAAEGAKLGDGHAKYGQFPAGGATARLPLRVGHAFAKYMMFSGAVLDGREAERRGLAELVTDDGDLAATIDRLVESFSAASPLGLQRMKEQLEPTVVPLEDHIRAELDVAVEYARSADRDEGLAAFLEGRTPAFGDNASVNDAERSPA